MSLRTDRITAATIGAQFGLPSLDDLAMNFESSGYAELPRDFEGTEEEREAALEAEREKNAQAEADEYFNNVHAAWDAAVERTLEHVGLQVTAIKRGPHAGGYRLSPIKSWADAEKRLCDVLEGHSYDFHQFTGRGRIQNFRDMTPVHTARQNVLTHWHWAEQYANVYGDYSAAHIFRRALR